MSKDTARRREFQMAAALLALSGLLSLALAWHHVALRDAWRVHDMALSHWQVAGEPGP
jgi:hypothetical protein